MLLSRCSSHVPWFATAYPRCSITPAVSCTKSGGGSPPPRTGSLRHPLLGIPAPWAPYGAGTKREHNTEGAACPAPAAPSSIARVGLAAKHGQTLSRMAGQLQLRIAPDRECPPVVRCWCDGAGAIAGTGRTGDTHESSDLRRRVSGGRDPVERTVLRHQGQLCTSGKLHGCEPLRRLRNAVMAARVRTAMTIDATNANPNWRCIARNQVRSYP